jgi:hypothetical protein
VPFRAEFALLDFLDYRYNPAARLPKTPNL